MNLAPLLAAWLLAPAPAAAQAAPTLSLKEAFARALRESEAVAAGEQSVRQAEALYRAALGGSFPELSARAGVLWQDPGRARPAGGQADGALRLTQAGLTGYRELAAVRAGGAFLRSREHERRRVEQLLLADLGAAFFGLLQARENSAALRRLLELAERRLGELRERVRVGRTREADPVGQEFQAASLQSQLEESDRLAAARADLLAFLLRAPEADARVDAEPELPAGRALGEYLARVESRPDIRALAEQRELAEQQLRVARAAVLPQLGLEANYYPLRPAARSDYRWDAGASVSLPIFSWGARRAGIDASRAALGRQELELEAARRRAELELRNAYRDYASAKRQLDIQRRAAELARRDYALQRRDEARGLITSLEVLESLNRQNAAELALNQARLSARLALLNLEIAAGIPFEEMSLLR